MWLAATLQAGGRVKAEANLTSQGFECYAPRLYCLVTRKVVDVFPGYMLVKTDELTDSDWESIQFTRGVSGVVKMGLTPCLIPDSEIQKFKAMEGEDGLIRLPLMSAHRRFRPGSRARLFGHHLSGHHGSTVIYQEHLPDERCAVLLHILGRGVRILVQEGDLAAA